MKNNKLIGMGLLVLTVATIIGMGIENVTYWRIYNYLTIPLSIISGVVLLKQK